MQIVAHTENPNRPAARHWHRAIACGALSLTLAACSTAGFDTAETAYNKGCGTTPVPLTDRASVSQLRTNIGCEAGAYRDASLGYIKTGEGFSYAFTGLAAGGAGGAAFNATAHTLKLIGLAAGGTAAINSVWSPTANATLYLSGFAALNCVFMESLPLEATFPKDEVTDSLKIGNTLEDVAKSYQSSPASQKDTNLAELSKAITAYDAAVAVAQSALTISAHSADFLRSQQMAFEQKFISKLNGAITTFASQQTLIQGYINSAQMTASATIASTAGTAQVGAAAAPAGAVAAAIVVAPPGCASTPSATQCTLELNRITTTLLGDTQGYASAATKVPLCLANVPS